MYLVDLMLGSQIAQVQHDLKIDWLELNETGKYLLFRDKKMKVHN
jgi:intraflagellar transport protein 172